MNDMPDVIGLYKHFTTVSPHKTKFVLELYPPMHWNGKPDGEYHHSRIVTALQEENEQLRKERDELAAGFKYADSLLSEFGIVDFTKDMRECRELAQKVTGK